MKRSFFLALLFFAATSCFGQFVITPLPNSGVANAPVDTNGWNSFKLTLTQNVTFSFVLNPPMPSPAQSVLRVIFTQDGTGGRTVTFASNILNGCSVSGTANATTVCQFAFDGVANVWQGLSSGGGSGSSSGGAGAVQVSGGAGAFTSDTQFLFDTTTAHKLLVGGTSLSPTLLGGFQYGNSAVLAYPGAFEDANIWTDSNNHHFFAEESQWNPGNVAMGAAGFNTAIIIGGTTGANHFASFQAAPICNTGGTAGCGTMYGFYDSPTIQGAGTGTINRQGLSVQAVALSGGATLNQNYGVYIAPDTAGNSNWAIVADKVAHSYLAGCLAVHGVVDCTGSSAGLTVNSGTSQFNIDNSGNIAFAGGKGQHIKTQAAGNDIAGTCTAAAATTCTVTFTTAYASAPACTATDQTNITTLKVTPSTTSLIITTSAATSDVFAYTCIGNPN